jgi:hypothetical protein
MYEWKEGRVCTVLFNVWNNHILNFLHRGFNRDGLQYTGNP